jgi:hypothetical protein
MIRIHAVVLAALGALLCAPAAAQSIMQPGAWEMALKFTAENAATGEKKTTDDRVSQMCLTKEYLSKEPYLTPGVDKEQMEQKGAKCSISDAKRGKNAASWRMRCEMVDGSSVDMTIKNSAAARKFTSSVRQVIKRGTSTGIVHVAVTSTHISECTKEMLTF